MSSTTTERTYLPVLAIFKTSSKLAGVCPESSLPNENAK